MLHRRDAERAASRNRIEQPLNVNRSVLFQPQVSLGQTLDVLLKDALIFLIGGDAEDFLLRGEILALDEIGQRRVATVGVFLGSEAV